MVVVLITGLSTVTSDPPVNDVYHLIVPADAVAVNSTCPDAQTDSGVTFAVLTTGDDFIVIVMGADVACVPVWQFSLDVRVTVTASLLAGLYDNVLLFVPASVPFTFH